MGDLVLHFSEGSVKDELKELQSDELVCDVEGVYVWWTASMRW